METNRHPAETEEREIDVRPIEDEAAAADRSRLAAALNELEAAKARVERDAKIVHDEMRSKLVAELLPVLDNFDRAIAAAESSGDAPAIVDGVRMVHRQLETVLLGYGLVRFDAIGEAFDPAVHEATSVVPVFDPSHDRVVVDQLQAGYHFGGRLLRAARVVVGRSAVASRMPEESAARS